MGVRENKLVHQKKSLIEALNKSLGIVSTACLKTKISRSRYYEWYASDPEFKKEVDAIVDVALDFAESKLLQSINNGSDTATIFYLKTKGKNRGYIEKQEIDHSFGGQKIKIGFKKPGENGDGRDRD